MAYTIKLGEVRSRRLRIETFVFFDTPPDFAMDRCHWLNLHPVSRWGLERSPGFPSLWGGGSLFLPKNPIHLPRSRSFKPRTSAHLASALWTCLTHTFYYFFSPVGVI